MKVILTDSIYGLGGRGEIVTVKDGYARNYLLPKKLAKEATPGNIAVVEQQKRKWALLAQQEQKEAQELASKLGDVSVTIEKKVGDSGTLYGSVTAHEIANALENQGFEIEKRQIDLGEPIKTLGEHEASIRLHREVTVSITVKVVSEEGEEMMPEAVAALTGEAAEAAEAEAEPDEEAKAAAEAAAEAAEEADTAEEKTEE
ncbi:MAG: 50S ribosomal protein L9 [Thermoanaerobaculia bacterium]|nr:50S ribosomal protein L9 [Thermoanaerobaculia bacterium]